MHESKLYEITAGEPVRDWPDTNIKPGQASTLGIQDLGDGRIILSVGVHPCQSEILLDKQRISELRMVLANIGDDGKEAV